MLLKVEKDQMGRMIHDSKMEQKFSEQELNRMKMVMSSVNTAVPFQQYGSTQEQPLVDLSPSRLHYSIKLS